MVLTRTDENELLTALYSAVFQHNGPWQLFLSRLRARTEADLCRLFVRAAGGTGWQAVDTIRSRAPDADGLEPAPPSFDDLRPGRVYSGDELENVKEGPARHLRISWPEGGDLALSLWRTRGDFRARDSALLASLAPHLTIALRSRTEMEAERRRNRVAEAALQDFGMGWLLIDARGRVVDGDPEGLRLLDDGKVMRRVGDGRLRFPYPEAEALLEESLAGPVSESRAAWLSIAPPIQMVSMAPPDDAGGVTGPAHCLILMRGMRHDALKGGRYLPTLFRLSRSEAALAALLSEGVSLADAATELGLTIETARNYSKRVYVKTGARGQADLVRIVLGGMSMVG